MILALACVVACLSAPASYAQLAYQRLRSFGFPELSACSPYGTPIEASDGKLYGTTAGGGGSGGGVVYKVNKDGSGFSVLHSFTDPGSARPYAGVVEASDGNLYGTTSYGGDSGYGTVFKLKKDGSGYTVLHSFSYSDGYSPSAGVVEAGDGSLYSTTQYGGDSGGGVVFKLKKDGSGFTVLHSFSGPDGAYPYAGVAQVSDGKLYGTTTSGGDSGVGTVYKLNKDGSGYTVVHSFSISDQAWSPYGGVVEASDGRLYGTTLAAGAVYRLNKDGSDFSVLHSFGGLDGWIPYASVVEASDGNLYGTTSAGGDWFFSGTGGTVFKINKDGSDFALLHSFYDPTDGASLYAGVVLASDGALYGAASGGFSGCGTIYKLGTAGGGFTVVRSFNSLGGDGYYPEADLLEASDGAIYGTTSAGGSLGSGIVFKLSKDGSGYAIVHGFSGSDGANLFAPVVEANDGSLYGTALYGGDYSACSSSGAGTVYRLNKNGTGFTVLHTFNCSDGLFPNAGLVAASDGALYGTTVGGGDIGAGTVFRLNRDGSGFGLLHSFNVSDGNYLLAGLVEASDGALYGTAAYGADLGSGTVFKLNKNGSGFANLKAFDGSAGGYPYARVAEGSDGKLYGTTIYGGDAGVGVVYKVSKDGSGFSVLHSFTDPDGTYPWAEVLEASDGNLYGTTTSGGDSGVGAVYKLNKDGSGYIVVHSFTFSDGANPFGGIVEASDGNFYGTATQGGDLGGGVVYRLVWTNTPNATVSGSGSLPLTLKVNATFGLTLSVSKAGKPTGVVGYVDLNGRMILKSTAITDVTVIGTHGHIAGQATVNGAGSYNFVINVDDLANPGAFKDKFSIKVSNGYKASGIIGAKSDISIAVRN